jgi:hypothetical protein
VGGRILPVGFASPVSGGVAAGDNCPTRDASAGAKRDPAPELASGAGAQGDAEALDRHGEVQVLASALEQDPNDVSVPIDGRAAL